jgi:hypothetical protein
MNFLQKYFDMLSVDETKPVTFRKQNCYCHVSAYSTAAAIAPVTAAAAAVAAGQQELAVTFAAYV